MKEKHTRQNYKHHWQPELLNKMAYDTWMETQKGIGEKSRQKAKDILDSHKPPRLSVAAEEEIERILKKHIGDDFFLRG